MYEPDMVINIHTFLILQRFSSGFYRGMQAMRINNFIVTIGLFLVCCQETGGNENLLTVNIYPVNGYSVQGNIPALPENAQYFKFTVSGLNMKDVSTKSQISSTIHPLPKATYGKGRQVTVEVCTDVCDENAEGDIVSRGRTVSFTINKGSGKREFNVFVQPRNSFASPISANTNQKTNLNFADRVGATVTLLDDGRILIAGGAKVSGSTTWWEKEDISEVTSSAEIFDPNTGEFEEVGPMLYPRAFHQAVKLADKAGTVVLLGGYTSPDGKAPVTTSASVEAFDPISNKFYKCNDFPENAGRALFTAGLAEAANNLIFIAGGVSNIPQAESTWDIYLCGDGSGYGIVGHGNLYNKQVRYNHTMTYLPNYPRGPHFVIMGGEDHQKTLNTIEAYRIDLSGDNPEMILDEASVSQTFPLSTGGRTLHSAVHVSAHGLVYVIGGFSGKGHQNPVKKVSFFWESDAKFDGSELDLYEARGAFTATLIDNNMIFIAGGFGESTPLKTTEVIGQQESCNENGCYLQPVVIPNFTPPFIENPKAGHLAIFDSTRKILILGGISSQGKNDYAVYLYNPD